jgi:hypothetical protein
MHDEEFKNILGIINSASVLSTSKTNKVFHFAIEINKPLESSTEISLTDILDFSSN